ncbi:MAG TPA: TIR domain-containing protein [Fibrobacteria bacterium]|nr:TIR domain-containing protein [Fibrobacteria bacterium]
MSFEEPGFDSQDEEEIPPFRVFIFHGRNPLWKELADFIWKKLEIETVALREEDGGGDVIDIDALDRATEDASHAVVVVTADDNRESMAHAIGYFQGLYGPANVLVLREKSVEDFTVVTGTISETFDGRNISHAFPAVAEEIEASKEEYDQVDDD